MLELPGLLVRLQLPVLTQVLVTQYLWGHSADTRRPSMIREQLAKQGLPVRAPITAGLGSTLFTLKLSKDNNESQSGANFKLICNMTWESGQKVNMSDGKWSSFDKLDCKRVRRSMSQI